MRALKRPHRRLRCEAQATLLVAGFALAACVTEPELVPAPGAKVVGEDTAVSATGGVRIAVDPQAWGEGPVDIGNVITPVRVIIQNDSGRLLRVRYSELTLVDPSGFRRAALPPYAIGALSTVPAFTPAFEYRAFLLAPPYSPFYPSISPWYGPFSWDPWYYQYYYPYWPDPLPTQAMLEYALPEGVLESGGRVSGFLYFQELPREVDRVLFRADLVDASTGEPFGEVRVPFVVTRGRRVSSANP